MNPDQIKMLVIVILGVSFIIGLMNNMLSSWSATKELPEELKDIYSKDKYEESVRYIITNSNFAIITSSLSLIGVVLFIYFDGFAMVDQFLDDSNIYPALKGVWFFGILFFASDLINLPLQLYAQFGIEARFGFNKMTYGLFFMDKLKSYVIGFILGGGILFILFWLLETLNTSYWYYFWLIISVFIIVLNVVYTSWIVPLFNKLTPLEEGELKDAILNYSEKVHFPVDRIFVMDGSKRSSKANAYFSGLGKRKKIVLYDTLIQDLTTEEIVAVLAHEAGHFSKRHISQGMVLSILQLGIILYISSLFLFNDHLSQAFGVRALSLHINLIVFSLLFSPISSLIGILMNLLSRKNEYEADRFAKESYAPEPLISALKKLSRNNFSNLNPHQLDVFLNYSHPTLLQRIRALNK